MKNLNILLGCTDRRAANRIEATLLDLCYEQAVATVNRVARIDEFVRVGSRDGFDLIIVATENLLPCPSHPNTEVTLNQVMHALEAIRSRHLTPILAVNAAEETHVALLEAGADNVLGFPPMREHLREQARQMLGLSAPAEVSANRWAWVGGLLRGLQPKSGS